VPLAPTRDLASARAHTQTLTPKRTASERQKNQNTHSAIAPIVNRTNYTPEINSQAIGQQDPKKIKRLITEARGHTCDRVNSTQLSVRLQRRNWYQNDEREERYSVKKQSTCTTHGKRDRSDGSKGEGSIKGRSEVAQKTQRDGKKVMRREAQGADIPLPFPLHTHTSYEYCIFTNT